MADAARAALGLAIAAAATACAAPHRGGSSVPDRLSGIGTEPFWNIALEGGRLDYRDPETPRPRSIPVTRKADGAGLTVSGILDGMAVTARVRPGACSDGMSDRRYPFFLTLTLGAQTRQGCAFPSDAPPPPGS